MSTSCFYSWLATGSSSRERRDSELLKQITLVHNSSRRTYGSRRVYRALKGDGVKVGKVRVERLMRENGIRSVHKRKFRATKDSFSRGLVSENPLNQCFEVSEPNRTWAGDITYIWTKEGWLYLAVLIDLYSRRVVGWAISKHITRDLPLRAIRMSYRRQKPAKGLMHHPDHGSQYTSHNYQSALDRLGMISSMSKKGCCYGNAVAKSFFHSLKVELIYPRRPFSNREEATSAVFEYIEVFYNRVRLHSSLDYESPEGYERKEQLRRVASLSVRFSRDRSPVYKESPSPK